MISEAVLMGAFEAHAIKETTRAFIKTLQRGHKQGVSSRAIDPSCLGYCAGKGPALARWAGELKSEVWYHIRSQLSSVDHNSQTGLSV
jgi:hypothetical protein